MSWIPRLSCFNIGTSRAPQTYRLKDRREAELLGESGAPGKGPEEEDPGEAVEEEPSGAAGLRRRWVPPASTPAPGGGSASHPDVEALDAEGTRRAIAAIRAFKQSTQASPGEENKEGGSKGRMLWKRVSSSLSRVDDAATFARAESNGDQLEFDDAQLTRISLRLDGMDSYSVLGALISGFSLQLISSITVEDFGHPFTYCFAVLFVVFGTMTTVSALYATIIFALCSLHGKAGVGTSKDAGYLKYVTSTAAYRESAFIALMSCFVGVLATLLCMLFMKIPLFPACLAVAGSAYFCLVAARHVKDIMKLASEHIYS